METNDQLLGLNKKQMDSLMDEISKQTVTYHVQRGVTGKARRVQLNGDKVTLIATQTPFVDADTAESETEP